MDTTGLRYIDMEFKKIKHVSSFYDDFYDTVFYVFETVPRIGHGEWGISAGGDIAYNLMTDNVTQDRFPIELVHLTKYIDYKIKVEGL